jgi:hypothetical protein
LGGRDGLAGLFDTLAGFLDMPGDLARVSSLRCWSWPAAAALATRIMPGRRVGAVEGRTIRSRKTCECRCTAASVWLLLPKIRVTTFPSRLTWSAVTPVTRERSAMGTKTITMYVSDIDQTEIPAGQAYELSVRHPDGSTQRLDISEKNYKDLRIEGLGKILKKRGRKPGSGTVKAAATPRKRTAAKANAKQA